MKFDYTKHKIRLDRGRMWYTMFQAVITAILVYIFSSSMDWKFKVLSAFIALVIIYVFGFIDDKLRLLDKEQDGYSKRNPILMEILKELEEIKSKL